MSEDVQQAQATQHKEQLSQYQSLKDEYKELASTITTLPDQTRHNIMVPFGGVAFMPGTAYSHPFLFTSLFLYV